MDYFPSHKVKNCVPSAFTKCANLKSKGDNKEQKYVAKVVVFMEGTIS